MEISAITPYRGWSFGWSGRNLTGISKSGTTGTYTYNNDGFRTTKTVNGTTTTYTYQGSLLMAQQSTGKNLYFSYDTTGKAVSVNYNGTEYYYLRNGQGDIVGILDQSGTKVVSYSYDSWGKLISTEGTLANTLGVDNPLRYRGYYYDVETGFYCLSSRYYDPEVGRFLIPDVIFDYDVGVHGYNLYMYCGNNPFNRIDLDGMDSIALDDADPTNDQLSEKENGQSPGIGGRSAVYTSGNKTVTYKGKTVITNDNAFNKNVTDSYGNTNVERMQQGLAPIGIDGKTMNIHHVDQTNDGLLMEITATEHRANYRTLHTNTGQTPSLINRSEFDSWRRGYWKTRSNMLE